MFTEAERRYLDGASLGRLATADADGRPHVIPVCFALQEGTVVTPIDEKPKRGDPDELRRSRDIRENPRVSLVVDHYASDWSNLGWVQVRGTAGHVTPGNPPTLERCRHSVRRTTSTPPTRSRNARLSGSTPGECFHGERWTGR